MRVIKDYDVRKKEILDAAQSLFYQYGYEPTTVNAIIDKVGISKGTFYHYFHSKEDLLNSLVKNMTQQILDRIRDATSRTGLDAINKLNLFFEIFAREKATTSKDLILIFLKIFCSQENLKLSHKICIDSTQMCKGDLTAIIRQGVAEGVFDTPYPDEASELILQMSHSMRQSLAGLVLELPRRPENLSILQRKVDLYINAVERILGAPTGCVKSLDKSFYEAFASGEAPANRNSGANGTRRGAE